MDHWLTRLRRAHAAWKGTDAAVPISAAISASFGPDCVIHPGARLCGKAGSIRTGSRVRIEHEALLDTSEDGVIEIGDGTIIYSRAMLMTYPGGSIRIGRNCTVNPLSVLYGHGGLSIGNFVRIATHVVMIPANHVFADPDLPIAKQGLTRKGITVGDDVWIGAGARILDGVTIGCGSVIAAGAVVNREVEPFSIVGGVPARVLGNRKEANVDGRD